MFGLGATVPLVEGLQLCRVFQCLNGIIMLRLIKHAEEIKGMKKLVKGWLSGWLVYIVIYKACAT